MSRQPDTARRVAGLVLLRHGQSLWNLENRFTGWVDIELTDAGRREAEAAGDRIKSAGILLDHAFTSMLRRAIETTEICLRSAGQSGTPMTCDRALNERHYGDLQGLNKAETAQQFGAEQVQLWRRSYDVRPPNGESLQDTAARAIPYFRDSILPQVRAGRNVLVCAHGNSLRAIVMHLDRLTPEQIVRVEIPTGLPIVYDMLADGSVTAKREL